MEASSVSSGTRGILVCKDFGSNPRDKTRQAGLKSSRRYVMSSTVAMTEMWVPMAIRQLAWKGHCGFIGGTTEAIDSHHAVIAFTGRRYISLRLQLARGCRDSGRGGDHGTAGSSPQDAPRSLDEAVAGFLGHLRSRPAPR